MVTRNGSSAVAPAAGEPAWPHRRRGMAAALGLACVIGAAGCASRTGASPTQAVFRPLSAFGGVPAQSEPPVESAGKR